MNKIKKIFTIIYISIFAGAALFSTGVGTSSLELTGSVGPRLLLDVTQTLGATPGVYTSIPLDDGDILMDESGIGVNVGDWSVSSNTDVDLLLRVSYDTFQTTVDGDLYSIPYIINNGTSWVDSGDEFVDLVRVNGSYRESENSGSIYLKRVDNDTYPPSVDYVTSITFSLESE